MKSSYKPPKRAALYIRVSHEEQAMNGYSLQAQENRLRSYATEKHYTIIDIYRDEGLSARSRPGRRKEFARMIRDIQHEKIDIVIFIKLDRWFRNVSDYYTYQAILEEYHVEWETTEEEYNTSTAQGRLYLNIKLSIAQNESDTTSERIRFVFADKIKRGEIISGKLPLGYICQNKHIVPDAATAPIVRALFQHYLSTGSIRSVVYLLASVYGITRSYTALTKLLRNTKYIGTCYGIENFMEPIVPQDLFYAVQEKLNGTNPLTNARSPSNPRYLFTGLLTCPECGHKLIGLTRHYKDNTYIYYQCRNAVTNPHQCQNTALYKESLLEETLLVNLPITINHQHYQLTQDQLFLYLQCHTKYQQWSQTDKRHYWNLLINTATPTISKSHTRTHTTTSYDVKIQLKSTASK
jgi:site-specific DNA recombinase